MSDASSRSFLQKVGLGAACAACCVIPMLAVAGVITGAAFAAGGAVLAALALVIVAAVLVAKGRADAIAPSIRLWLVAAGGAGAFAGLWGLSGSRSGAPIVIALSVAVLATAALLALVQTNLHGPGGTTTD